MSFLSIPIRSNGDRILRSWFNTIATAGAAIEANASMWTQYNLAFGAFSAAALTKDVTLFSLAAKEIPEAFIIKHSTAFAGTAISSVTMQIGIVGETDRFLAAYNVFQATGATVFAAQASTLDIQSFTAATDIIIRSTSIGANLTALNAGVIDVWVKRSKLT